MKIESAQHFIECYHKGISLYRAYQYGINELIPVKDKDLLIKLDCDICFFDMEIFPEHYKSGALLNFKSRRLLDRNYVTNYSINTFIIDMYVDYDKAFSRSKELSLSKYHESKFI